jgi:hypothetical protein
MVTLGFRHSAFGGIAGRTGSFGPLSKTLFTNLFVGVEPLEVRESRRTSADELEVGTLRREIK